MTFFEKQNVIGGKGERVVAKVLADRGWEVYDARNSRNYQQKDIDYVVHKTKEGKHYKVEVKTDRYIAYTGNLLVENASTCNPKHNYQGWIHYTEADVIAYVCAHTNHIYIVAVEDIKEYIAKNLPYEVKEYHSEEGQVIENYFINLDDYTNAGYYVQELN